jgi:alkanesulfonate monooxygenase SsuD/methylene tetrahydromethanopterin reductase-like flavin-dependent oxidoreductase (luciferase family)
VKAALFTPTPYAAPVTRRSWPVPVAEYQDEVAERSMQNSLEQFQLADECGFDWVTLAEHHFAPLSLTPNPMVMAAAVTQRVKRAKIALLGMNIPTINPVRTAEEFAMVDVLSGGRVVAGMLRGTSNEYVTYNTNPAESRERFQEAMELIVKCWTEPQPFGWQGRHFQFRTISIWPRPLQKPHPPIYMSGSSPESSEFAARNHVKLGFAVTTLPLAREAYANYRRVANECGWDPEPDDVIYRVGIQVAKTDEEAREAAMAATGRGAEPPPKPGEAPQSASARAAGFATSNMSLDDAVANAGYYGRDLENQRGRVRAGGDLDTRIENGQLLCGSPDTILRQARRLHEEVGAGILDLIFPGSQDRVLQSIELFGKDVLPRLREIERVTA